MEKNSIWSRINIGFWKAMKKIGVWEWCPNCESAWTGGRVNPEDREECIVCGQDKKTKTPNEWVWGWIVPGFISRWIIRRRINRTLCEERRIDKLIDLLETYPDMTKMVGIKNLHPSTEEGKWIIRNHLRGILRKQPTLAKKLDKIPDEKS